MNNNIKKTIMKMVLLLVPVIFSFADDVSTADNVPFSKVERIDWNLVKVKNTSAPIVIDRTKVPREIYSIRFQGGRVHGKGADNIYFAPYTSGENNSLSIRRITGAYMVPLFEMENFSEHDYFQCLEKVYRWELHDRKLKLYTYDKNNEAAILEFIPIYK